MFNQDELAEAEALSKIKNASDEYLSEMLCEIGGYGSSRRSFLQLLDAVRKGDKNAIGEALHECLFQEAMLGIDGNELARQAEEDARFDAA